MTPILECIIWHILLWQSSPPVRSASHFIMPRQHYLAWADRCSGLDGLRLGVELLGMSRIAVLVATLPLTGFIAVFAIRHQAAGD